MFTIMQAEPYEKILYCCVCRSFSLGALLFARGEWLALAIMPRLLTPQTLDYMSAKIGLAIPVMVPEERGAGHNSREI